MAPRMGEKIQMISDPYNNIGIGALAIESTLCEIGKDTDIAKMLLVMPIIMHRQSVAYLADGRTNLTSFTTLLYKHPEYFTNFPQRFESSLANTINSIQMLCELELVQIHNNQLKIIRSLLKTKAMGMRAQKIMKAAPNIANLLNSPTAELYLNFRVEL